MFCSNCGTQLPDGAMFCTSCGNTLNNQPAAPMMPAEPVAPVMDAPMMDAPVMPAAEPVMDAPAFNPAGQYPYNNVPNNMPYDMQNNMTNNNGPKKSKAPLFIGLGIGAVVIAVITIVLILVLSGNDDKKKKSDNKTTGNVVSTEETTTEEETTEEPATEEPTTNAGTDVDSDDAEDVLEKFMKALDAENYSKAANYMLPALIEACEDMQADGDLLAETLASNFLDPNGDLLDWEFAYSYMESNYDYEEFLEDSEDEGIELKDYSSYVEPTAFATVQVTFTYEDQESYIYVYLAYVDGEFYVYDYDDSYFDIEFETESETPSSSTSDFDFNTSLMQSSMDVDWPVEGTVQQFDGFTMTVPDEWSTRDGMYICPEQKNAVTQANSAPLVAELKLEYLESLCNTYIEMGFENFRFGNLNANGKTGYFMNGDYMGKTLYVFIFFNATEDKVFLSVVETSDKYSDYFYDALGIAASVEIQ